LQRLLRALSPRAEFLIVILGAFGYFLLANLLIAVAHMLGATKAAPAAQVTESDIRFLLTYEVVVFAIVWGFLYVRGWTFHGLGVTPTLRDSLYGAGLAIAGYAVFLLLWFLFRGYVGGTAAAPQAAPGIALMSAVAISIVNPMFEEVFVCGYVVSVLHGRTGVWSAVNVSVAIRLAYHLYQGPFAVISIVPLGLIFAYWYLRTGRLWPVVVAHGLLDLYALLAEADSIA
jgi:membrane protease YdiL (CAAX protease family)